MTIRQRVRDWLGLTRIDLSLGELHLKLNRLNDDLTIPLNRVATVLLDETNDARQALSHKLGDKAVADIIAEAQARRHTLGEV